ncbi:MAG: hypothetical protein L6R35_003184 [Caloplaca aegaea]|nr:MAG: hypothetical protein L6R35_003184 [Caloplaca aegaea]
MQPSSPLRSRGGQSPPDFSFFPTNPPPRPSQPAHRENVPILLCQGNQPSPFASLLSLIFFEKDDQLPQLRGFIRGTPERSWTPNIISCLASRTSSLARAVGETPVLTLKYQKTGPVYWQSGQISYISILHHGIANRNSRATMATCHTRTQQPTSNSAPLPSPSSQPAQWLYPQAQARNPPPTSQPQATSQQTQGHIQGVNNDTSISKQDFCLIAEAAKRAQMAVLMRDLGEVTL